MTFPRITKKSGRSNKVIEKIITVEGLDGGVNNAKDDVSILNNQLSHVRNMWWDNNALFSRPGFRLTDFTTAPGRYDRSVMTTSNVLSFGCEKRSIARTIERRYDENVHPTIRIYEKDLGGWEGQAVIPNNQTHYDVGSFCFLANRGGETRLAGVEESALFIGGGDISTNACIYAKRGFSSWSDVTHQGYAPIILTDGVGCEKNSQPTINAKKHEDFNILTPKFRAQFTTQGVGAIYFYLPIKQLDDSEITITYTNANGIKNDYKILAGRSYSDLIDNIRFQCNRGAGYFYAENGSYAMVTLPAAGIANNMEFSGQKTFSGKNENPKVICGMRHSAWFGGDKSDGNSGVRLFLAGNDDFPGRIHWSAAANDLYFPRSNFTYVGEAGQKITALAKQDNRLVVFKENEIYAVGYSGQSRSFNRVQFPIVQISSNNGCDCPTSIQTCNGRLVWLNSKGAVCTLTGVGSGAKAIELSRNISRWFEGKTRRQMFESISTVFRGSYFLLLGKEMFVMNFDKKQHETYSRGLISGDREEISWYKWDWDFGFTTDFLLCDNEKFMVGGYINSDSDECLLFTGFLDDALDDIVKLSAGAPQGYVTEKKTILAEMKSKTFDFGDIKCYKNLHSIWVEIEVENGELVSSGAEVSIFVDGDKVNLETDNLNSIDLGGNNKLFRYDLHFPRVVTTGISVRFENSRSKLKIGRIILNYDIYSKTI